jgi:hypothetical protein
LVRDLANCQCVRNRRHDQRDIIDRSELNKQHAFRKERDSISADSLGQSRFANPTRTGQRNQASGFEQLTDRSALFVASDEDIDLGRQVRWHAALLHAGTCGGRRVGGAEAESVAQPFPASLFLLCEVESVREEFEGVSPRSPVHPTLKVDDGARADPGTFGKCFLGESGGSSCSAEELTESWRCVHGLISIPLLASLPLATMAG